MFRLTNTQVLCGVLLMLVAGTESVSGAGATPSYSPRENLLKIWEPCLWDKKTPITPGPGNEIVNAITAKGKTQGYTWIRYPDTKKDDSYEKCTRKNWDAFAQGAGVAYVNSHGNKGVVVAVVAGTAKPGTVPDADKYARQWAEAPGTDWGDIQCNWWNKKKVWACDVRSAWFTRNWRNTFNANRSIVVIESCKSAAKKDSLVDACGGRVGFGYGGKVFDDDGIHNNGWLFGRMNGTRDDALKRVAGDAFSAGGYKRKFNKTGNDLTTLCPSVLNTAARVWVSPVGWGAPRSGTGYVYFDTHCAKDPPTAAEVLEFETEGNVTISNERWSDDWILLFDYETDCIAEGFQVKVIVLNEKLEAEGGGDLHLDGGTLQEGQNIPPIEGVAPNTDDFEWRFGVKPAK